MWLVTYPLKGTGPWLLGIWVVVMTLITTLHLMAIIGIFALTLSTAMLLLYIGDGIARVSRGLTQPEAVIAAEVNPLQHPASFLPACALLFLFYQAVDHGLPLDHLVIGAGLGLVLAPAWFLLVSDGFTSAAWPPRWWRLARGLGLLYPLFATLVTGALLILGAAVDDGRFWILAPSAYAFVVLHIAAAKVLWLRRTALDLYTEASPEQHQSELTRAEQDERSDMFAELHRLCRVDEIKQAHLKLDVRLKRMGYEQDEWVHYQLAVGDPRLYLEHAYHYIDRLLAADKRAAAWRVCQRALVQDPRFRPSSVDRLLALADAADGQDRADVIALLSDVETGYPDSDMLPRALFTLARTQFEIGDPVAAAATLERLSQGCPTDAQRRGVRNLTAAVRDALPH